MNTVEEYNGECQRLNDVFDWLIFNNVASSRKELAKVIGFSESMLSQIANDKQPISDRFLNALSRIAPMINIDWISSGEGEMTKGVHPTENESNILEAVKRQQELVAEANKTLGNLVGTCGEDVIKMQLKLIASYQTDLASLVSKLSIGGGAFVYKSNINSLNNSNNMFYGASRGRKPNSAKFNKKEK